MRQNECELHTFSTFPGLTLSLVLNKLELKVAIFNLLVVNSQFTSAFLCVSSIFRGKLAPAPAYSCLQVAGATLRWGGVRSDSFLKRTEFQVMLALHQDVCQRKQPSHLAADPGVGLVRGRQARDRKPVESHLLNARCLRKLAARWPFVLMCLASGRRGRGGGYQENKLGGIFHFLMRCCNCWSFFWSDCEVPSRPYF